ncbi:hypothetical protein GCM10023075_74690 [Streptosporangium album]|nr:alcohol dehydrogenase catalytic domain-containing protein [Streptosporangium album]
MKGVQSQLPEVMPAAYVTALGGPESITFGELPVPVPGPGEVLVEVEVLTVNPVDTLVRSGSYPTPTPFPFVVGRDLAGAVRLTGSPESPFRPGDRVWCNSLGHGGRQGSFAGFAVVPADRLYPRPRTPIGGSSRAGYGDVSSCDLEAEGCRGYGHAGRPVTGKTPGE